MVMDPEAFMSTGIKGIFYESAYTALVTDSPLLLSTRRQGYHNAADSSGSGGAWPGFCAGVPAPPMSTCGWSCLSAAEECPKKDELAAATKAATPEEFRANVLLRLLS